MNVLLIGPPGAGKGTISNLIEKKYNYYHLDAGSLIRKEIAQKTVLGKIMEDYANNGKLIPDDLVIKLVLKNIPKNKNIIFDGFPRTLYEAKELDKKITINKAIFLNAKENIIIERISGRRLCPKCGRIYHIKFNPPKKRFGYCDFDGTKLIQRKDDKPEVIKQRLKVYKDKTKPLLKYYEKKIIKIDANDNNPEKILKKIEEKIKF